ncbi:MAG TPA: metallophosphoesterase [Acidimicrobiia bacterium]
MIRLAAVGDVHFGADSGGTWRPSEHVSDDADALLVAGDLTQIGSGEEARVLADELAAVTVPTVAVLGNHDHHSGDPEGVCGVLESAGVHVLEGQTATFTIGDVSVGVVGATGFGGGFAGASGTAFGEAEMKQFIRRTERAAERVESCLTALDTDVTVALLHYAPVKDTVVGERPEIYPFLGSFLLGRAIDAGGADLVVHGHAHAGSEQGVTPGGVRVRNVALPLIRRPYRVFAFASDSESA